MSDELKGQLMFAIFTAEESGKTKYVKAEHIIEKMRAKYGGYWSAVAAESSGSYFYIRPAPGHLAIFDYDGERWHVYEHDCSNQLYTSYTGGHESVTSYALPTVTFRTETEMNSTMKEQLLFAIYTAENGNIVGQAKVDHIGRKMENVYGGTWSVLSRTSGYSRLRRQSPYYAWFDYEGKQWFVYKNRC